LSGFRTSLECRLAPLLLSLLVSHALFALDPNRTFDQFIVNRWGSRESFPGGVISAIAQTPDGYLWIGTEKGLVRFDGVVFRLFEHDNTPSLPAGHVRELAVDSEGILWVRMESPYLMRYRGGKFQQMYPERLPGPYAREREQGATALTRGPRGDILAALPHTPLRYTAAGKFDPVATSGVAGGLPISIAETADGAVWVGMRDTGLFRVRNGVGAQTTGLPDQKVNVLLPGSGAELWIGTDLGLVRWDGVSVTRSGIPATLARTPVLALAKDRDSTLWVSTPKGVTRVHSNGSVVQTPGEGLPGTVRAIFEDREGNIWLGGTDGLMQIREVPFLCRSEFATDGASLYLEPTERVWVGPSSGGLHWFREGQNRLNAVPGVHGEVVYSIDGAPGDLWIASRSGGVTNLKEEAGLLQARAYGTSDGLPPGVVHSVLRSRRDGSVWAGALSGAISRVQKGGRITTFNTAHGLGADAVTTLQETPDGTIWAGTAGGLVAFRNGRWRKYSGNEGLPPGRVNSLVLDGEGVLWIGAASGLFYWSGSRIESARDAPPSLQREIYGLAADDSGSLWVVTGRHVVSISRPSLLGQSTSPATVREFGLADGLPSTQGIRRDRSVVKAASGRIWLSLQGGLCVINPAPPSAVAPAIVAVESVVVDGRPLPVESGLQYPSSRQRVVFSFIGVSLTSPGRVRYRYMLEGYDGAWSQPTETREAAYTGLPPARYTFRVMASNSEGLWNGVPAVVVLNVEPQMSETWWFRGLALVAVGAAVAGGIRYRLARIHTAMNLRFEERLAERTRIARELHDTLLQSFQGLMLRLQVVDDLLPPGKAKEQLEQSLERADQAIAEGRSAVYDLRSSALATNDLAEAVRDLGAELSTQDSTSFHLVVEGTPRDMHPIVRDELYRITREALRNAFRHAGARRVETELTYGDRTLRLRIRDDGHGIAAGVLESGRPGHYGLSGMRERAHQIGARLEIWSGPRAGTEIELSIAGSIAYRSSPKRSLFVRWKRKQVDL
jgi:signal transduction histidine kinase/ligand-binding sensor domain-containing protein